MKKGGGDSFVVGVEPLTSSSSVVVRSTPYTEEAVARGVFAARDIARGTLIERSHCLMFTAEEHVHAMRTVLQHYTFCAGGGVHFLALGIGSLFNHSDPPNVEYRVHRSEQTISFQACRDIKCGEELCIFYGRNLWFQDTNPDATTAPPPSAQDDLCGDANALPFAADVDCV